MANYKMKINNFSKLNGKLLALGALALSGVTVSELLSHHQRKIVAPGDECRMKGMQREEIRQNNLLVTGGSGDQLTVNNPVKEGTEAAGHSPIGGTMVQPEQTTVPPVSKKALPADDQKSKLVPHSLITSQEAGAKASPIIAGADTGVNEDVEVDQFTYAKAIQAWKTVFFNFQLSPSVSRTEIRLDEKFDLSLRTQIYGRTSLG